MFEYSLPGGGICNSLHTSRQHIGGPQDNFFGVPFIMCGGTRAVVHQLKQSHPLQSTLTDLQALLAHHVLCLFLLLAEDSLRRTRRFGEAKGTGNASSGRIYHYRYHSIARHTERPACRPIASIPTRSAARSSYPCIEKSRWVGAFLPSGTSPSLATGGRPCLTIRN